jgi:hypothetical protein
MRLKLSKRHASSGAVVLAGLCFAAPSAHAQVAANLKHVGISDVLLGMSDAQAEYEAKRNIIQARFAKKQGTLHDGSAAAGVVLFGEDVSEGADPKLGAPPAVTHLAFTFGMQLGNPVIYIERHEDFAPAHGPSVPDFMQNLEAEYGQPTGIETDAAKITIVFHNHSAVPYSSGGAASQNCLDGIRQFARASHDGAFSATFGTRSIDQIKGCGTWLVYDLYTGTGKNAEINALTETLGNGDALAQSYDIALNRAEGSAKAPARPEAGTKPQL